MPGQIEKVPGGWKVRWGGKLMSRAVQTRAKALVQLRALYASENTGKAFGKK